MEQEAPEVTKPAGNRRVIKVTVEEVIRQHEERVAATLKQRLHYVPNADGSKTWVIPKSRNP